MTKPNKPSRIPDASLKKAHDTVRAARTPKPAPAPAPAKPSPTVPTAAVRDGRIFARNPHLNERQANAGWMPKTPAPTLFNSGDLPPYTASGNDPAELARLPWQLRHAAAKADQREWSRLFAEYDRADVGPEDLVFEPAAADPGNGEYGARFDAWLMGR